MKISISCPAVPAGLTAASAPRAPAGCRVHPAPAQHAGFGAVADQAIARRHPAKRSAGRPRRVAGAALQLALVLVDAARTAPACAARARDRSAGTWSRSCRCSRGPGPCRQQPRGIAGVERFGVHVDVYRRDSARARVLRQAWLSSGRSRRVHTRFGGAGWTARADRHRGCGQVADAGAGENCSTGTPSPPAPTIATWLRPRARLAIGAHFAQRHLARIVRHQPCNRAAGPMADARVGGDRDAVIVMRVGCRRCAGGCLRQRCLRRRCATRRAALAVTQPESPFS